MPSPSSIITLGLFFTIILSHHLGHSIPACIIIDTNMAQSPDHDGSTSTNRSSSSILLRNLRMLDHQRSTNFGELLIEPIPLSYIDVKKTSPPLPLPFSSSLSTPISINPLSLKKSLADSNTEQSFSPCSLEMLNEIETQMVVPFEFRRLRIEQPDRFSKFLDDDPRQTVPDLSTAVYERRSDPDGLRFCRTCRDGLWTQLTVCDTVRCDAELLRANPRLVTEWGEIKPLDGGALYAPSTVYAIYAFAFGPHCKQCEPNGQWSRYALPELCSGIKFFGHPTSTTTTPSTSTSTTSKAMKTFPTHKGAKVKATPATTTTTMTTTTSSSKATNKKS